jgi:hypothetical protein
MKTFKCSGCDRDDLPRGAFHEAHYTDRKRVVTSRCRLCRSEDYFTDRYETVCGQCRRHRPLNQNHVCKQCNEDSGLRECRGTCGSILPALLSFDGKRTTCKSCRKLKQLAVASEPEPASQPRARAA